MSELNSVTLNSSTLGSGGATTGSGGNVVNFSGTIAFEVVFSLNSGGVKTRKFSLVSRQQLNAFIGEKRFTKVPFSLYGTPRLSGAVGYRVRSLITLDGPLTLAIAGTFSGRTRNIYRLDAPLILRLVGTNTGTDLSTTPAPLDRVSFVPGYDRVSYSRRG